MRNSILTFWLHILTVCIFFRFWQSVWCRPCILGDWSCYLVSLLPPVHFLSMWLNGIIAITNNNGDYPFPMNIPLWIFTSDKLCPPADNSTLQFFLVFSTMTSLDILYNLSLLSSFALSYAFLKSVYAKGTVFRLVLFLRMWDQCIVDLLFSLFPCGILSILLGTVRGLFAKSKSPP